MKRLACIVPAFVLLLAVSAHENAFARDYRELEASHDLAPGQHVYVDFTSGDLDIESTSGQRVEVELELECKWDADDCEELLDEVEIDWRSSERRLMLRIEGLTSWRRAKVEFDGTIRVPANAPLTIDMGAGALEVDGRLNDLEIEMGVGELRVWMPESAVESVSLDVGVGDAKLRGPDDGVDGGRSLFVGSEFYWDEGKGSARVDVELGVGDAVIYLD
jgi:hypothetical protein